MSRIAAFLVFVIGVAVRTEAKRGFLLTAPKVLQAGAEEQLCMTFHDVDEDVVTRVELLQFDGTESYSQVQTFQKGKGSCFKFRIPRFVGEKLLLAVRGQAGDYVFAANKTIGVEERGTLTFIQTDKPIYKPGQTVQFRILTLSPDLKPVNLQLPLVAIMDASGARVMQWNNVTSQKGLFSLKMPLSEEPVLGAWTIKAEVDRTMVKQTFKVEEYVLPKFEVTVSMPSYVMVDDEEVKGEICAKYTYGKPVKGTLVVRGCVSQRYYGRRQRPCVLERLEIDGCVKLALNATGMMLSSNHWSMWNARVKIDAEVTEEATGITLVGNSSNTKIERNPIQIDLSEGSPAHFKPGLPFHGKAKVTKPDGSPAPGEHITLSIRNYRHGRHFSKNFTSDDYGEFTFKLPPVDKKLVEYRISAVAFKYNEDYQPGYYSPFQPRAYLQVKQWFSPSASFIQVEPIRDMTMCGQHLDLDVLYTTPANTSYKFYYQVMSRGNIVLSGHKHHHFKDHDAVNVGKNEETGLVVDEDPASIYPQPPEPTEPEVTLPEHVASMPLRITIHPEMSPIAHLLIYYIRDDGETVADSIKFNVKQCFENQVSLEFSDTRLYPGEAVSLRLEADPGSLCAIGVIDKSVHLLGGNNQLNMAKLFEILRKYDLDENSGPYVHDTYCDEKIKDLAPVDPDFDLPPGPPGAIPFRRRRSYWPGFGYSKYYDSSRAFKRLGTVFLTDLAVETSPCDRHIPEYRFAMEMDMEEPDQAMLGSVDQISPAGLPQPRRHSTTVNKQEPKEKKALDLRTYFPETWLWQIREIGSDGRVVLREQMPHSLTEWVGSSFCTNEKSGFGVSAAATVQGFQPFFTSFTLPYSVVRGEKVPVIVTVFNYLSRCLVVELTLKKNPGYRVVKNARSAQVCVCGAEAKSHTFSIIANQLGNVNITVKAQSVSSHSVCGNGLIMSSQTGARDAVTRQLLVEPEGREEEYTVASYMCPTGNGTQIESMDLPLPDVIVEDSARAYVTAIGDVMGPTLSGLDQLLRLPTGCGEQNMLKFAPNIFVLQYLTGSNQAAPAITNKALEYMRIGYQRELRYRHTDGSYSAFGQSDPSGSMWLTAFVVKSFAQASKFIHIDQEDLEKSLTWFKSKQLENGCFPQVGTVHHKSMKGGLLNGGSSPAALTAYVLAAMLEAGIDKQDEAVTDALLCLRAQETEPDVYTTALLAYTYTLYSPASPERAAAMDRLAALAKREDGMIHWEAAVATETPKVVDGWIIRPYYQAKSADVEMTAYALLAQVLGGEESAITTGVPIVKWLSKQRNAYGGFSSTQDTVVALHGLAEYASLVYGDGVDMEVKVEGQDFRKIFTVTETNSLVLQSEKISVPNRLAVTVAGSGCVLVQANVKYNVYNMSDDKEPAFVLRVSTSSTPHGQGADGCKKRAITVCTRYTGPGNESNMAIIAVKMVSGYIPDKDSIKQLMQDTKLGLKRYEVDKNWANLYFDQLTTTFTCVKLIVEQETEITNAKPAFVHVYDYYDKDLSARAKYKLRRICGTKNELPVLTPEEYEKTKGDSAFLGQHRLPIDSMFTSQPPVVEVNLESLCPTCLNQVPKDFLQKFCLARHGYKVEVRSRARFPLKMLADLRPSGKKINLNRYTNFTMPANCRCSTIVQDEKVKVVILTKETELTPIGRQHGTIHLSADVTILPMTRIRPMEQQMRRVIRKKRCGRM